MRRIAKKLVSHFSRIVLFWDGSFEFFFCSIGGSEESSDGEDDDEDSESDDEDYENDGSDEEDDGDGNDYPISNGVSKPGFDSGCTAVVAVLRDNKKLYVANAGK